MIWYAYFIFPLIGFIGMFCGGFWSVGCGWLIVPTMLIFGFQPLEAVGAEAAMASPPAQWAASPSHGKMASPNIRRVC